MVGLAVVMGIACASNNSSAPPPVHPTQAHVIGQPEGLTPTGRAPTPEMSAATLGEQDLGLTVSVQNGRLIVWSTTGLEGTLQSPKLVLNRNGAHGERCDDNSMCESGYCDGRSRRCDAPSMNAGNTPQARQVVFDFRKLNDVLYEIAKRRYAGKPRPLETYRLTIELDPSIQYTTLVALMDAARCTMPEFGTTAPPCLTPSVDAALSDIGQYPEGVDAISRTYAIDRVAYNPDKHALFPDVILGKGQ